MVGRGLVVPGVLVMREALVVPGVLVVREALVGLVVPGVLGCPLVAPAAGSGFRVDPWGRTPGRGAPAASSRARRCSAT
ncbi:MAG TPA: hypothetical protein VF143_03525, partial [Candidatus Nanopelagicales bacterium]